MIESCSGMLFGVVALILAVVALAMTSSIRSQLDAAVREIARLRTRLDQLGSAPRSPTQSQVEDSPRQEPQEPSAAEILPVLEPEPEPQPESASRIASLRREAQPSAPPLVPAPPSIEPIQSEPQPQPQPKRKVTLEELFVRVIIWVAAVALAISGPLFVKYSFDNNLISAKLRIIIAVLAGLSMTGAGYYMHHRLRRIASALVAAGVTTLLAATFAAVHVEHLISTSAGFVALAVITAAAVMLSLRHGPIVALIALIGGFATPVVVGPVEQPTTVMFMYMLLLEIGLVTITRRRAWFSLMLLTLVGGYGWSIAWIIMMWDSPALGGGMFVLFLAATAIAFVVGPSAMREDDSINGAARAFINVTRWIGAIVGLVLVAVVVRGADYATTHWMYLGLLSAGCIAIDRFDPRMRGVAWLAMLCSITGFTAWMNTGEETRFGLTLLAFGLLFAGGAYVCLWRSDREYNWAMMSFAATVIFSLIGYLSLDVLPWPHFWSSWCAVMAVTYMLGTWPVYTRRDVMLHGEEAVAAMCMAVAVALACIVPLELDRQWISVAWALMAPAVLVIHQRLRVEALVRFSLGFAALAAVRLLANPFVLEYPVGETIIFNWLLYGYGVPAAAMALAAWLLIRSGRRDNVTRVFEALSIIFTIALVTLEVRHGFHPTGMVSNASLRLIEAATYGNAWLAMAIVLFAMDRRRRRVEWFYGGVAIAFIAMLYIVAIVGLFQNPLWEQVDLGSMKVFNWLLYAYGLPALLLALAARVQDVGEGRENVRPIRALWVWIAFVLSFALVSLEVRHAFQGPVILAKQGLTAAENYTHSVAWIAYGALLLAMGIRLKQPVVRYVSMGVMMLTAAKVFLWDMKHLRDLWRVFSFFGLGVSLLMLAYVYQRFVFRIRDDEE